MKSRLPEESMLRHFDNLLKRERMMQLRYPSTGLLICLCMLSPPSMADQWIVRPEIKIGAEYDSNPRLVEDDTEKSASSGDLRIALGLERRTEISNVSLRPRVRISRYSDDKKLDTEDLFLDFSAEREFESSSLGLDINVQDQAVRRGEIESAEFDDTGVDDDVTGTGRISVTQDRTLIRVRPRFTHALNTRLNWTLGGTYMDVSYDPIIPQLGSDYTNAGVDTGIGYRMTEKSQLQFAVFANQFESDNNLNETSSFGARIGINHNITERSSVYAQVGYQDFNSETGANPVVETKTDAFLWNVGLSRRWTSSQVRLQAGYSVTPSSAGFVTKRRRARASFSHRFGPRFDARIAAIFLETETLGDVSDSLNRDFLRATLTLAYELSRKWSLEAEVGLTDQDDLNDPGDAQSTSAGISLVYRPPIQNR